jgi:hypothetical protein
MSYFINLELLENPLNWLIMFLMVAIAFMGAQYVVISNNS